MPAACTAPKAPPANEDEAGGAELRSPKNEPDGFGPFPNGKADGAAGASLGAVADGAGKVPGPPSAEERRGGGGPPPKAEAAPPPPKAADGPPAPRTLDPIEEYAGGGAMESPSAL
jgi:hypothetical protein